MLDRMHLAARTITLLRDGGIEAEYDGLACAGDSGGGIWDAQGRVIGIVHSRSTQGPDRVFASDLL